MASASARPFGSDLPQKIGSRFEETNRSPDRIVDLLLPEQLRQILRDLRLQQIELEMQNVQLRQASAAAELSKKRYLDLYNTAPVAYITVGKNNRILDANLKAVSLLGMPKDELLTKSIIHFIRSEDESIFAQHRKQLIETLHPQSCELRMQKNCGTPFWARLEAAATLDEEGLLVHRIVLSDITESRKIQEERLRWERQRRQLQKSESLSRMAGAIAHHFNNQLQAVMMSLELAMSPDFADTNIPEHLAEAMQSAQKAAEVSNLMLIYLGQSHAKRVPLDLSEVCRHSVSLLKPAMPQSVELKTKLPSPGPIVRANATQMQQVLSNLLTNAWEALGDKTGQIHLSVKTISSSDIPKTNISPMDFKPQDTDYACLEVHDAGCGMSDQDIEKLFDPFFSTKFTGRGLGLPVVLGIVRSHKGVVAVESRLEHGSSFRVYLPLTAEPLPQKQDTGRQEHRPQKNSRATLLIVEDDPMVRQTLAIALQRLGHEILVAADGVEAVQLFTKHQEMIHGVFCDLTMPRMNGWETIQALRKLKPGIPVVLASGYSKEQVMAGRLSEMPNALLNKPYKIKEVEEVLSQVIKT